LVSWAAWPNLDQIFHGDVVTVARYIRSLPEDASVYITPTQKYSASLLLALGGREAPRDFYGPTGLLPAGTPQQETWYIVMPEDTQTPGLLETIFPSGGWAADTDLFRAYHITAAEKCSPSQADASGKFGSLITLCEHEEDSLIHRPGDTLEVRLTWQAHEAMDQSYTAFVHLLGPVNPDTDSPLWAQDDHEPGYGTFATDRWFQDELVTDVFHLPLPESIPAGEYILATGFYRLDTMTRLQRDDGAGDVVELATITVVD
jgi:hypothetical protein